MSALQPSSFPGGLVATANSNVAAATAPNSATDLMEAKKQQQQVAQQGQQGMSMPLSLSMLTPFVVLISVREEGGGIYRGVVCSSVSRRSPQCVWALLLVQQRQHGRTP